MTMVQEMKAPAPAAPESRCACCNDPLDGRSHYCARCIEGPRCSECRMWSDGDVMCDSCARRYGLRTVRQLIEWRVLIGQLDKAAGAAVLEIIEMAEERLP